MQLVRDVMELQAWSRGEQSAGRTIGLVPTMGFLHAGHASLMRLLRAQVDVLVVSIFVNPLQFGPDEDLDRYPRDLDGDLSTCEDEGVDLVFHPDDFYPDGFSTSVSVHGLTDRLCGANRPGHFEGVTTVCSRLFGVTRADKACFGEKDFQQLMVIRRMVEDLGIPVEIVPAPLVRDADGLALSSRNKYLSDAERQRGLSLSGALFAMQQACDEGQTSARALRARGRAVLAEGLSDDDRVDYLELVDAITLEPIEAVERSARALVAVHVGDTRLIDNVRIGPELAWT